MRRHRRVAAFVDEMEWLHRTKGVRFFWIADENPTTIKDVWREVLEEIARRRMDVGMCASIRRQDVVRDADILPLYKRAGFTYVLLGIETVTDETLARVRKGASVDDGYQAVRLLRQNGIMSIVDYIFGLDEETPGTIWRGLRGLHRYDGDFVNALYVTPHSWTPLGRALGEAERVEEDQWKWDYRHQVVAVKALTPGSSSSGSSWWNCSTTCTRGGCGGCWRRPTATCAGSCASPTGTSAGSTGTRCMSSFGAGSPAAGRRGYNGARRRRPAEDRR